MKANYIKSGLEPTAEVFCMLNTSLITDKYSEWILQTDIQLSWAFSEL
jgi:hypothetical protein